MTLEFYGNVMDTGSGYNVVPPHEEISNSQFPMLSINTTNGALKSTGLVKKEYMDEFWTVYASRLNVIRIGEMGMGVDNRTFDRIN